MDEDHGPQSIAPAHSPRRRRTVSSRLRAVKRAFTTKKGLIGDYDYAFLFRPNLPFMRRSASGSPFFGLNDRVPVLLSLLQHALAMLAGIITPPLLLSGTSGANLEVHQQQYLVSTALIISGVLSTIQITRYYVGTGVISVVGISFNLIPVALGGFQQMYANG
ncbi:Purine permease [Beauveria bassiana D1-5]|uniref:Purine permease n=1 Tax=Beauveria bassiana D1-5 TaxID=1245745 RepID=A0A0A2VPD6_BEABA|nr:Purine permease [Beauveria bassiana D1-5]